MSARTKLRVETLETRTTPSLTPVGPEFRVNTVTEEQQWFPSVAASADGQYVVAFAGHDPDSSSTGWGIFFCRYDSDGLPIGNQQMVSETPDQFSVEVSVGASASGEFVVAWNKVNSSPNPSPQYGIRARRFDQFGTPLGPVISVFSSTTRFVSDLDMCVDTNGSFAIAWIETQPADQNIVWMSRYANDGTPIVAPTAIAQSLGSINPKITIAPNGVTTTAWRQSDPTTQSIWLRQVGATGQLLGAAQPVTGPGGTNPNAIFPKGSDLMARPDSSLVISYAYVHVVNGLPPAGNYPLVFRMLSSSGVPLGTEVVLPNENASQLLQPTIALGTNGRFVITYNAVTGTAPAGNYTTNVGEIRAKEYSIDGSFVGPTVVISSSGTYWRSYPNVAMDADGDGFIAWNSAGSHLLNTIPGQDGSSYGVFARRFIGDAPGLRSSTINNGEASKSEVKSTSLAFTRQLVLPTNPASAFTLTGPSGIIPVSVDSSASTPAGAKLKLTFPSYPNGLPNGRYTLRGLASQIHDTAGQALDGNGDGVPGDDYVMNFHRLAGDFDGDGTVAASDFILFRLAFGSNDLTFDLDGDGTVNAGDFVRFRLTFGSVI